jgi:2-oxoglutarate dehydrogenase E1 component
LKYQAEDWVTPEWESIKELSTDQAKISGVELNRLKDIGNKITHLPKDKEFHRLIKKIFEARSKSISDG